MKQTKRANPVVRLAVSGAVGLSSLLGGCSYSSDTGVEFDLVSVKLGRQEALYRKGEDRTPTDLQMFEKDCSPYDKSQLTDGSGFFKHYKLGTDGWKNIQKQE